MRDAEGGHHGVAGELLDGAAVGLDAALDPVEEGRHAAARDLRVLAGDELGRRHEVSEQNGCEFALHEPNSRDEVQATVAAICGLLVPGSRSRRIRSRPVPRSTLSVSAGVRRGAT